jgi:hypothetical protein
MFRFDELTSTEFDRLAYEALVNPLKSLDWRLGNPVRHRRRRPLQITQEER